MKKLFLLLAKLPANIHNVDRQVDQIYGIWKGIYGFLHPNGPPTAEPVAELPAEPAPVAAATPAVAL